MLKSDIISALEKIPGDPEIEVTVSLKSGYSKGGWVQRRCDIDRINEYPRPEIVVIEK